MTQQRAGAGLGRLQGKVAFITGAARGQGRAHAVRLASEGADIIAVDICAGFETVNYRPATPEDLEETVRLVELLDRRVVARHADVRDMAALQSAFDEGLAQLGRVDIVVANAGILNVGWSWEMSDVQWREIIDVNLTGVWHTAKAAIPAMIRQGEGGSIIFTSSVAGLYGQPFTVSYTAAKHGVVGIATCMANELAEYSIRVNTIHPTGVETEMVQEPDLVAMVESKAETLGPVFMNGLPIRFMQPEDVSSVVAFLASDDAKTMTGSQVRVDCGKLNR
jgi:SDR family mycofactocin-dependent oxidoreductase